MIDRLAERVRSAEEWRWLEVSCSLAAGRGDLLSDVDAAVGHSGDFDDDRLEELALKFVEGLGVALDVLVHVLPGWPAGVRRLAAEFQGIGQLDLVVMPAERRVGLPTGAVAVVDKDGRLTSPWRPPVEGTPTAKEAREWLMLGWWALSDVAKHLQRGSLFEAVERLNEVRQQALRLHAAGSATPFPSFGLVSLLDYPPYEAPADLIHTYAVPHSRADIVAAAGAAADLLEQSAARTEVLIGQPLATAWAAIARTRLAEAESDEP